MRTFEAEIAEKIRTSSLGEKLGVLIKKKGVLLINTSTNTWIIQEVALIGPSVNPCVGPSICHKIKSYGLK